jgi:hypothetical protein
VVIKVTLLTLGEMNDDEEWKLKCGCCSERDHKKSATKTLIWSVYVLYKCYNATKRSVPSYVLKVGLSGGGLPALSASCY